MLAIRFNRVGKKNQAAFRVVLQEKTKAPGRRHVEVLGSWNPHTKEAVLKNDRILHWIGQGAEVSDSVHNLLVKQGVIEGEKRAIKMKRPEAKTEEAPATEEAKPEAAAEAPTEEAASKETPAEVSAEETPKAEETPVAESDAEEEKKEETPVAEETPAAEPVEEKKEA